MPGNQMHECGSGGQQPYSCQREHYGDPNAQASRCSWPAHQPVPGVATDPQRSGSDREADRLECEVWNASMWFGGPATLSR